MELTNSDILRRMQSKVVSKEIFDFDKLTARPLISMLDYSDLDKLYNIASSVRYSGNIKKKLDAIRQIMHQRGFKKQSQGTNRIVYSYFEDPSIVLKIATDKVGMKDNPREFLNQELLKPFVTKVFEVTPDGVVGEFERVQPITSREEFLSCSDEAYELLNTITTKYIMADVGSKYFLNFGIRPGFGLVLLDFSYLYEVDANKLMCSAPNPNEPSGICGGWIDYDQGFNELLCTKCGARYRAVEIAKGIEENKIVRKGRKSKMKVAVNWNDKVVNEVSLDGQIANNGAFKTPTNGIIRPSTSEKVGKLKVAPVVFEKKPVTVAVTEEKVEEVKEEEPKVEAVPVAVETVEEPEVVEEKKIEVDLQNPVVEEPKVEKKTGMKIKVTTQDGKAAERTVERSSEEVTNKKSSMKVNDTPTRHYRNNNGKDLPRRSQIQLTAITFEQLKELDFKYSSTDLEFHKMFFRAEHEKSNPSVMIDFDSIPKEKLELISGIDVEEIENLKDELEKAKSDLNTTEEALASLRKVGNDNSDTVKALQQENTELKMLVSQKDQIINDLEKKLEYLLAENQKLHESTVKVEDIPETEEASAPVEEEDIVVGEYDTDDVSFIYGTFQTIENICESNNIPVPENPPANNVITFAGSDDGDYLRDQNGKIICMAWLQDYSLDDIIFQAREPEENEEPVIYGNEGNNTEE